MKIAVLGTGLVGRGIASGLVRTGHDVCIGSRTADSDSGRAWAEAHAARHADFATAAADAEVVWNCLPGPHCVEVLSGLADVLAGKVLVDLANALDWSADPPQLLVGPGDSLAERIQRVVPGARVVKTLNTVNAKVMADPAALPGAHDVFLCGDDADARATVRGLLEGFGWEHIHDLGALRSARGTEAMLIAWLPVSQALGTDLFNWHLHR